MNSFTWYNLTKLPVPMSFLLDSPYLPFEYNWYYHIFLVHFYFASRIFPLSLIFSNYRNCTFQWRSRVKSHLFKQEYSRERPSSYWSNSFFETNRHLRVCISNLIINYSALILNSFILIIFSQLEYKLFEDWKGTLYLCVTPSEWQGTES